MFNTLLTKIKQENGNAPLNSLSVVVTTAARATTPPPANIAVNMTVGTPYIRQEGRYTMKFVATVLTVRKIETARRKHDNKTAPVVKRVHTPVAEFAIDAADMNAARHDARMTAEYRNAATEYADAAVKVTVNYDIRAALDANADAAERDNAAAAVMDAARMVAYKSVNLTYSNQALPFLLDIAYSIAARRPSFDADDIISAAAAAMIDADARAAVDVDNADAAPVYVAVRAAYNAANTYLHDMRRDVITTSARDIMDYCRMDADAAERAAADEYDNSYFGNMTDAADAAALDARAEYIDARRRNYGFIRAALDAMTPKQARAVSVYAACNSMRAAAAVLNLKNQSTVARHIDAARRAAAAVVAVMTPAAVPVELYADADARRAERAAAVIDNARAVAIAADMPRDMTAARAVAAARDEYAAARARAAELTARARAAVAAVAVRVNGDKYAARADADAAALDAARRLFDAARHAADAVRHAREKLDAARRADMTARADAATLDARAADADNAAAAERAARAVAAERAADNARAIAARAALDAERAARRAAAARIAAAARMTDADMTAARAIVDAARRAAADAVTARAVMDARRAARRDARADAADAMTAARAALDVYGNARADAMAAIMTARAARDNAARARDVDAARAVAAAALDARRAEYAAARAARAEFIKTGGMTDADNARRAIYNAAAAIVNHDDTTADAAALDAVAARIAARRGASMDIQRAAMDAARAVMDARADARKK